MSKIMNRANTQAILIDMQDRLLAVMPEKEELVHRMETLLKGLAVLHIPVTVTQQYTKGLGMTDERLMEAGGLSGYLDKITYSCYADEAIREQIRKDPLRTTVLLFGIETHICLWQTAQDLLEEGYAVEVVCDCVASRKESDREIALRRLEKSGAVLTTTEACLFELLEKAGTDEFRAISKLIK